MAIEMDAVDKALLNLVQQAFPLCARPWAALGQTLGLSEAEVLVRLDRLKRARVLRQISAIFDSKALGYRSALVAARAPEAGIEACAAVVSAHAGVSHNYQRDHSINLWFTLAVPPGSDLDAEAARLGRAAGLLQCQVLPSTKTFRIGVSFDMGTGKAQAMTSAAITAPKSATSLPGPQDRAAIRALQEDLPLTEEPFAPLAQALGWSLDELFDWMAKAGACGWLRRFAAVLRHREAGFGEGGMGVWAVPLAKVEAVGRAMAMQAAVTHCYQRPAFDGWPYNLFTMVHGADRAGCEAVLSSMAEQVHGWTQRAVLFSTREFKKERVRYFLEDAHAAV